jgi:hypothetical protein
MRLIQIKPCGWRPQLPRPCIGKPRNSCDQHEDHIIVAARIKPLSALIIAWFTAVYGLPRPAAAAADALDPVIGGLQWGESADTLKRHFGTAAVALAPPLDFGDAEAPVALRHIMLGGYDYTVFFQLDKKSHGLKRVIYDRRPRAANPKVFEAAASAITAELGQPQSCRDRAGRDNGYQAKWAYFWRGEGRRVRAIFRDSTIEGGSGCPEIEIYPCGLDSRLIILIDPDNAPGPDCG